MHPAQTEALPLLEWYDAEAAVGQHLHLIHI